MWRMRWQVATAKGATYSPISSEWEFDTCTAIRFGDRGGGERTKARIDTDRNLVFSVCGGFTSNNIVLKRVYENTFMQTCGLKETQNRQDENVRKCQKLNIWKCTDTNMWEIGYLGKMFFYNKCEHTMRCHVGPSPMPRGALWFAQVDSITLPMPPSDSWISPQSVVRHGEVKDLSRVDTWRHVASLRSTGASEEEILQTQVVLYKRDAEAFSCVIFGMVRYVFVTLFFVWGGGGGYGFMVVMEIYMDMYFVQGMWFDVKK